MQQFVGNINSVLLIYIDVDKRVNVDEEGCTAEELNVGWKAFMIWHEPEALSFVLMKLDCGVLRCFCNEMLFSRR